MFMIKNFINSLLPVIEIIYTA